ncbi:NRT1-PTR FAMILY 4-4 protein [Nymphaea thermarum]|nr:NRT1-PTR FAMILY 4-4 protein [Nymphaea thermarum]
MVTAALVENNRRQIAEFSNQKISIFWIAPQFLIFGLSEMFTAVGLIEFFYKQSVAGMQSFLTAMTYCSYSFGFFFSSVLCIEDPVPAAPETCNFVKRPSVNF